MLNKLITTITLLFITIRELPEIIKAFEIPGNGEQKKKTILSLSDSIYDAINGLFPLPWDKPKFLDFVGRATDIIVAFYNMVGFFTHSGTTE